MKRRLSHLLTLTLLAIFVFSGLASVISPLLGPVAINKTVSAAGTGTEYVLYYPNTAEFKSSLKAAFRDDPKINQDSTVNLLKQTKVIVRNADHGLGTLILTLDTKTTKENDLPEYKTDYYCTPTQGTDMDKSLSKPDGSRPYVRYTYGLALDDNHAWGGILDDAKDTTYVGVMGGTNVGDVTFPPIVNTSNGGQPGATFKIPGKDGDFDIRQHIETRESQDNYYGKEKNTDKYTFQNATDDQGNPIPGASSIVGDTVAVLGACMPHPKGYMDDQHKTMNYWKLNDADKAVWDQAMKDAGLGDNVEAAATAADATADSGDAPGLDCKVKAFNPLTWLICPAVKGLVNIVGDLDDLINSLMTVGSPGQSDNPTQIFCPKGTSESVQNTCNSYHIAWASFRNIALGLIAVAGLVVLISQALGFEILDAYTIRKVLPRILIAAVAITISWQLMQFFVTLTNDLGFGIRYLIYQPFTHLPNASATLQGGGVVATSFIAGTAIAALGIFGVLSFAATAALAVFIAFIVLVLRQMIIIVLIVAAPVAIVAYVMPNTQKMYKLWWDSFSKALLMFPIVAAMIASGRVFAVVANTSTSSTASAVGHHIAGFATFLPEHTVTRVADATGSTMGQLIGFAAYFAPYFLMPLAFRFAGGALAGVGGFVNNRGRGGFDRLKQYRGNQRKTRYENAQKGTLWKATNPVTQRLNRAAQTATLLPSAAQSGMMNPNRWSSNMQAARATQNWDASSKFMQEDAGFQAIANDDDKLWAVINPNNTSAARVRQSLIDRARATGSDRWDNNEDGLDQAVSEIMRVKRQGGDGVARLAAVRAQAKTGTGFNYNGFDENGNAIDDMNDAILAASGGDSTIEGRLVGEMGGSTLQSGRVELGAAGFAARMQVLQRRKNALTGGPAYSNRQAYEDIVDNSRDSSAAAQAIYGKPASARALGESHARNIQRLVEGVQAGTHTQRDVDQALAAAMGVHDAMGTASPQNQRAFADSMMAAQIVDPTSGETTSVYDFGNSSATVQNDAFQQMRRDLAQAAERAAAREQASASAAAAAVAAQQAAATVPGATTIPGAPTGPPRPPV